MACDNVNASPYQVTLQVNDGEVALNGFVETMVAETVLGMLKPLRDTGNVQKVTLEIRCVKPS